MSSNKSHWYKWITEKGNIRAISIDGAALAQELCSNHKTLGFATQAFSEALVGAMLIAGTRKSGEKVNLKVLSTGPIKQAVIDAQPDGGARGFIVTNSDVNPDDMVNKGPWGGGFLSVLHTDLNDTRQPYLGAVHLDKGILDLDINHYWEQSEQVVTLVGLNIEVKDNKVIQANGVIIQALGSADESEKSLVKSVKIDDLRAISKIAEYPDKVKSNLQKVLHDQPVKQLEKLELNLFCNCSHDKVINALLMTGEKEVKEMTENKASLDINCDFCRKDYKIMSSELLSHYKTMH